MHLRLCKNFLNAFVAPGLEYKKASRNDRRRVSIDLFLANERFAASANAVTRLGSGSRVDWSRNIEYSNPFSGNFWIRWVVVIFTEGGSSTSLLELSAGFIWLPYLSNFTLDGYRDLEIQNVIVFGQCSRDIGKSARWWGMGSKLRRRECLTDGSGKLELGSLSVGTSVLFTYLYVGGKVLIRNIIGSVSQF